jgi:F-type H+-transporting ATPase subunit beta
MPSRLGYQPTLATEIAELEERICSTGSGAITSVQAVYVPADDFTDPAATHTFAHLSSSIVLSRKRASEGLYPAMDPLLSGSKMLVPSSLASLHRPGGSPDLWAMRAENYMLGLEELSGGRRTVFGHVSWAVLGSTVLQHRAIHRSGGPDGALAVPWKAEAPLNDVADYPERSLYMIGKIDEARQP